MKAQRSAETCRRLCIYCVHISRHVRFVTLNFSSCNYVNFTILNKKLCPTARYLVILNCFISVRFVCVGFISLSNIFMLFPMNSC